jgi:adenylylsulfate kinase
MPKKIKINRNKGIVFWIEGFSGSGKTTIAKKSHKLISKMFGKTIVLSGDTLRNLFNFKGYSKSDRIRNSFTFTKFIKFLTSQKINVIYTVVGLNYAAKSIYKKSLNNFIEIFISADIQKILKMKIKKRVYKSKKNIVGIDIKPEFPKKANITIRNNFDRPTIKLSNELIDKLQKMI